MADWQQIAIGVLVARVLWAIFAPFASAVFTVFARRSSFMARWVAESEAKDQQFWARVKRQSPLRRSP